MANLWLAKDDGAGWVAVPLSGAAYGLTDCGLARCGLGEGERPDGGNERVGNECVGNERGAPPVMLVRHGSGAREQWAVLARAPRTRGRRADVHVNGAPLVLGVGLLADRDEVAVVGATGRAFRCYYSAERLARVVPFPTSARPVSAAPARCPRCKQPIAAGQPAVPCPACGAWHHQSDELPCWAYSSTCAMCDQPTALDAGYRWTPEDL